MADIPSGSYNKVATAPDGVPVYQNGSQYFTHNADGSFTEQYQNGTPDWLKPAAPAAAPAAPAAPDIAGYYASRGVTPYATSVDYWNQKWNEWGKNDPAYFQSRLAQADEFTGVGPNYNWQAAGAANPGTSAASAGAPPASAAAPAPAAMPAPSYTPPPQDPRMLALYNQLLARSTQSLNVSPDDPIIKSQTDAANVAGSRSLLKNEQAFAERSGPYATGAVANNARMGSEALGENLAGLTSTLMANEVTSRRAEIAQALGGMFGILNADQQAALREEDQKLASRQTDLQQQQNAFTQQMQAAGFTADQAYRTWQEMFAQQEAQRNQSNTVWDQNWKASGGA